jgi:D-glycero-D-manno-heptose 1,7-bisphosphate phosphatase
VSFRPAVFLDRDGVINVFPGAGKYVLSWSEFRFMPEVRENLARLRKAGFFLTLITSQSGVGRGLMTQVALDEIHAKMQEALGTERFDAICFCPHRPDEGCPCRKPSPWMIQQAAQEHGLDLARSFVIGDTSRDIVMGRAAGCRTVLCRSNLPRLEDVSSEKRADRMFATLAEAVEWILSKGAP